MISINTINDTAFLAFSGIFLFSIFVINVAQNNSQSVDNFIFLYTVDELREVPYIFPVGIHFSLGGGKGCNTDRSPPETDTVYTCYGLFYLVGLMTIFDFYGRLSIINYNGIEVNHQILTIYLIAWYLCYNCLFCL